MSICLHLSWLKNNPLFDQVVFRHLLLLKHANLGCNTVFFLMLSHYFLHDLLFRFFFFFFVQVSLKHGAPKEEKNKNTKRLIFGQSCWSGRSPLARWQLSLPLAASDNEAKISNHPFRAPWRNNRVCNCVFGILIWRQTAEFLFYKNTVNSDSSNECFGGGGIRTWYCHLLDEDAAVTMRTCAMALHVQRFGGSILVTS